MAAYARVFGKTRRIRMTIRTLVPHPFMRSAVYRKIQTVVLQILRRQPVRVRRMAIRTRLRKLRQSVLRILRPVVIALMARYTFRTHIGITPAARMAFGAIRNLVPLGQREKIVVQLLRLPVETRHIVAVHTIGRKARGTVIGVLGPGVIPGMAGRTGVADALEAQARLRFVAIRTVRLCVRPQQRKTVVLVQLRYAVHQPVVRTVAARAIRTYRALMDVGVAGLALRFRLRKHQ